MLDELLDGGTQPTLDKVRGKFDQVGPLDKKQLGAHRELAANNTLEATTATVAMGAPALAEEPAAISGPGPNPTARPRP